MAVNDHLKWLDFKDLTQAQGLWDQNSTYLMPPEAFQILEDCYPQPDGGVRAFFKATDDAIATPGVDDISVERMEIISPLITSTGIAYLLVTSHATTGLQKWYYRAVGATTWSKIKTFSAPSSFANRSSTTVTTYHDNTNGRNVWAITTTHNKSDSTEDGLYLVRWDTGGITFVEQSPYTVTPVVQYQSRLVYAKINTLVWTDPGAVAAPSVDNFLTVQSGNNDVRDIIAVIVPYAPSQLLVGTVGSGWWVIDGDIEDPVVRQMGDDFNPWIAQVAARTQEGIVFYEAGTGTFMTQNLAANFQRLDLHLAPHAFDLMHSHVNSDGYIFAPGGRVYDTKTSCWFSLSAGNTTATPIYSWHGQPSPGVNGLTFNKGVFGLQHKASGKIIRYQVDEVSGARAESYRFKTAPLQAGNGRQAVIREIEIMVSSFHASSTIAVTVDGVTRTSDAIPVGTNVIRLPFKARGEYLDVLVTAASNASGYEAPMVEQYRIGVRDDGHTVRFL